MEQDTDKVASAVGTDGAAGPSYTVSVAGTESGGALQELRTDSDGHLQVDVLSGGGGVDHTDDSAFTVAVDSVTPAGGIYNSGQDAVDDGDAGALRMTSKRALMACLETPDGDSAMDDTNNAVKVNVVAGSGSGVSHVDDAAFTVASDDVVPAAGMFNDTSPDSVDEGDAGVVRMSANRNLYATLRDAAGNERGVNVDASNQLTVAEGNSAAILADTAAIDTNMAIVAGAVAAGQMQVDIVADGAGLATEATLATIDADTSALAAAASGAELLIAGGATQTNDLKVTLDSETVELGAGTAAIGKLAANDGVDIGDVDVASHPVDTFVAGDGAYGKGVLIQGDDATDRHNLACDTSGRLKVDIAEQSDASPLSVAARDRTTDNMGVALQTDAVMSDTTVKTPQFAVIDGSTSGNNTLVAAGSGKIRVLSMVLSAHGNVNVTIQDGAGGSALCGPLAFDADTQPKGLVLPFSPVGYFETTAATLLNMSLDAAIQVAGSLVYIDV